MKPGVTLGLALLALVSLAPRGAGAYVREVASGTGKSLYWPTLPMKFNIHSAAAPGLSATATQAAVRAGYTTWSTVSCTAFRVSDQGVVNQSASNTSDKINSHIWMSAWPSSYDNNALGITQTMYDPSTGKIIDADTVYNPNYTWGATGSAYAIDAQSVATHEIGHQLGLDHSPYQDATMFYATGQGNTSQRSLSSDDIAGVCAIYPSGTALPPECTGPGDCAPNETCQNQKCVANAAQKGYGASCQDSAECVSTICVAYGSNTFCSQGCDSQACPNGDQCLAVSGGGGISKACLPGSSSMGTKTLGQPCQTNPDCKTQICVSVPGKGSLCSQKCDLTKQDCPSGYECANSSAGGLCIPATTPTPPPPPTKKGLGEACTVSSDCESTICAKVGGSMVCIQLCVLDKAGTCPAGFICTPAGGGGACVKEGTPNPTVKGALGAICTTGSDCDSGLCVGDGGALYCTQLCDPAAGCPGEYDCVGAGGDKFACTPKVAEQPAQGGGGCALGAPGERGPVWLVLLAPLAPLLLLALRPRRSRSRTR